MTALDKLTLLQLKGTVARGFAFDRYYGTDSTSDGIYTDCVADLVNTWLQGYSATVLAYGATGSGKTLTMSGGVGTNRRSERGIIPLVAERIFERVHAFKTALQPGESISVRAHALELYNEDLRDLSPQGQAVVRERGGGMSPEPGEVGGGLKLQERPAGREGTTLVEVVGVQSVAVDSAAALIAFFGTCFANRAVAATSLNDASSRSHAIYSVVLARTLVEVAEGSARVRTSSFEARLDLVDLAGSERVKRSGATGNALVEAASINTGLLALGNVIAALSEMADSGGNSGVALEAGKASPPPAARSPVRKRHIPYRDSKLTRLLQDGLGGRARTLLIACVSGCEADFAETMSTLKYANRACRILNTPLPARLLQLEEDLLPALPLGVAPGRGLGMAQLQALLAAHHDMKAVAREAKVKERAPLIADAADAQQEAPHAGSQRSRVAAYDEIRKRLVGSQGTHLGAGTVIVDGALTRAFRSPRDVPAGSTSSSPVPAGGGARVGGDASGSSSRTTTPVPQSVCAPGQAALSERVMGSRQHGATVSSFSVEAAMRSCFSVPETAAAAAASAGPRTSVFNASALLPAASLATQKHVDTGGGPTAAEPHAQLLVRFRVNPTTNLAVYRAINDDDYTSILSLLPRGSELPSTDMSYLIARMEVGTPPASTETDQQLEAAGTLLPAASPPPGPAVGCLMATFGSSLIPSVIFNFQEPPEVSGHKAHERVELWGLQIPQKPPAAAAAVSVAAAAAVSVAATDAATAAGCNDVSAGPLSTQQEGPMVRSDDSAAIFDGGDDAAASISVVGDAAAVEKAALLQWTSVERLTVSCGLLLGLCHLCSSRGVLSGMCVPRPALLRRWLEAGLEMRGVPGAVQLVCPEEVADFPYYQAATVAYFLVEELQASLTGMLSLLSLCERKQA